jgi:hypothetical protein
MIWILAYQATESGSVYLLHEDVGTWNAGTGLPDQLWAEVNPQKDQQFRHVARNWVMNNEVPGRQLSGRPTGPLNILRGVWTSEDCIYPERSSDPTLSAYFAAPRER